MCRTDSIGLVELGQEMLRNCGLRPVESRKEVMERWPCEKALSMLHLSMRPFQNTGLLIGMATAFASLHCALVSSNMLCQRSQGVLEDVAGREQRNLAFCLKVLEADEAQYTDCLRGYSLAKTEIEKCFDR